MAVRWISPALLCASLAAAAAPTQRCNTSTSDMVYLYGVSAGTQQMLASLVANPASNPNLFAHLWQPLPSSYALTSVLNSRWFILKMDPFQDVGEIVQAMRTDPVVAQLGATQIAPDDLLCFEPPPPPPHVTVTEYHNTFLDHYFLSSSAQENAIIDAGGAGPGWVRTGESFRAISDWVCYGQVRVFRFYTRGANSHFYTADADECGKLRNTDPGWISEGIAFAATLPTVNGVCASSWDTPVYRLYNNRWMFNDSNHRYTTSLATYQQMQARGWVGEGVAMCVSQGS